MFSLSHRTAPGCRGHTWYLQVGIKYLDEHDSKTTMLLGLSSLMDILPSAIEGIALHPLGETSTLPVLINNRPEDRFPGSVVLAFKYFLVKDKQYWLAQQIATPPPQPLPHQHKDKE
jgi:hypothetical protein